jgi:penicillin-binding protein 1A
MVKKFIKHHINRHGARNLLLFLLSSVIILFSLLLIWVSTFRIPSLDTIEERKIGQSTKIYDSTGKILLYDVYQNAKRTAVPFEEISSYIKEAVVSIEDKDFYTHKGFKPTSFIRAVVVNTLSAEFAQGGSTITQQVVKNSILVGDKTITRKLKEIALSLKLERVISKDQILSMYLNENPYGGTVYGVEEASQVFFGKSSREVTLAEAVVAPQKKATKNATKGRVTPMNLRLVIGISIAEKIISGGPRRQKRYCRKNYLVLPTELYRLRRLHTGW